MNIRTRLTVSFATITSMILVIASVLIYLFSEAYRTEDFYQRLINKGTITARLLIEVDEVDSDLLRKIESNNPLNLWGERIYIYDYKDALLFTSDTSNGQIHTANEVNEIRLHQEVRFQKGDQEGLGFLFADRYNRFVVFVYATDIYGISKVKNLLRILLIVSGAGIFLVVAAGWMFASQAVKPIAKVIHEVENIGIDNLHIRVSEGNGSDEIARLASSFNRMLNRLDQAFRLQKNFIANASHELRTPLTIVSGQIEVLMRKDRSVEEYKSILASVSDEIQSLSLVANQLLMLAQTSSSALGQNKVIMRIDELMWSVRTDVSKSHPDVQVEVVLSTNEEESYNFEVVGNPFLMRTAILNVVENAAKYTSDNSVRLELKSSGSSVILTTTNSIQSHLGLNKDLLTEPFYRGDNSISTKGHGLGLSLVSNIIERHGGRVVFTLSEEAFVVEISLPTT